MQCVVCGANKFQSSEVLWPELIEAWEINEKEIIASREPLARSVGIICAHKPSPWRFAQSLGIEDILSLSLNRGEIGV